MSAQADAAVVLHDRDDGFGGRLDAIRDGLWTPEMVGERMIEAIDVLHRSVGRVGPRRVGNGWPAFVREWEDLLDEDSWRNHQESRSELRPPPDRFAVSRSDHALEWLNRFLLELPLQRDALWLWAAGQALGRDVEPFLRKRKRLAEAAMPMTLNRINAERERERRKIGRALVAEANARMDLLRGKGKLTPERRARIAREMHERAVSMCAGIMPLAEIRPTDAMPDRCLSPRTYHRMRKAALATIADGLNLAGEKPPVEDLLKGYEA